MARSLPLLAALLLGALTGCAESIVAPPPSPAPATASPIRMTCDPDASDAPCDDEGAGAWTPPPGLIVSGVNPTMCADGANYPDSDYDQLNDVCEEALAAAFAPTLMQWTDFAMYDHQNGWTGGEYYHGVVTTYDCPNGVCTPLTRIAYLPAYYADGGEGTCGFPTRTGCGHDGDSEFIIVDLAYDGSSGRYRTVRAFLSAHCNTSFLFFSDTECKWWDGSDLTYRDGVARGAPVIWAAAGSNANYRSNDACNGGTNIDVCVVPYPTPLSALSYAPTRFPVSADYNVGSYLMNVGYVHARRNTQMTDASRSEAFFSETYKFRGWQGGDQTGVTPYGTILTHFGFGSPYGPCAQGMRVTAAPHGAPRHAPETRGALRPTVASRIEYVPGGGC